MITKKLLILFFMSAICQASFAQTKAVDALDKFHRSIERSVMYPAELIAACKPTYAFMKITVTNDHKWEKTQVSDNADKLFTTEVILQEKRFDKASLEVYLKENQIKNVELLIPMIYTLDTGTCPVSYADMNRMASLTDFFNTSVINKPVIILKPVAIVTHVQR